MNSEDSFQLNLAIITTVMSAVIFIILTYNLGYDYSLIGGICIFLIYLVAHVLVGFILFQIYYFLAIFVDYAYDSAGSNGWREWMKDGVVVLVAFWPIVGIPLIIVTFVGALLGILYSFIDR